MSDNTETGLVRLRREAEIPRPRLERMLVAWALANVFLVVTMCGGLVAIRANAPTQARDAGAQVQVQHRGTQVLPVRVYETPSQAAKNKRRLLRCGTR